MFDEENAVTIFSTGSFSMLTFCIFVVSVAINKYEEDKRIVSKLIEPPSVIVAPSNEFCNGFLYLVVVYTRVNEPEARNRFRNSYGTLCSKSYSLSNFVRENCTSVRAVLKLDDDVEWNVQKMVAKMATVDVKGKRLYCEVPPCGIPQRLRGGKYFISWEEWPHQFFPPYCVSAAYFGSPHTFVVLHDKTSMAPHIWLDDVFSTGVVGSAAGVSYEKLNFTKKYSHTEFLKGRTLTYGVVKGKRINRTFIFEAINGRTT
ncbi:N-acetyllactosaminide 3-alpha-galactosyltransferase [Ancylostoma caninum]|uniref:Hexosyltransferase n=1 Tax=Ancylostoma caninum TaxID=29170 RepID=A0A368H3M6_ANCCA|nr:N-acetyllactosaminide 3-alpha-galactosyltransferase [Ancylostoma caninum]